MNERESSSSLLILTIIALPIQGAAVMLLWNWFVVPQFDAPELTLPIALGLSLIPSIWRGRSGNSPDADAVASQIIFLLFVIATGFIANLFV